MIREMARIACEAEVQESCTLHNAQQSQHMLSTKPGSDKTSTTTQKRKKKKKTESPGKNTPVAG